MPALPSCPSCGGTLQMSNRPGEKAYCPMCDQVVAAPHQPAPAPSPYQAPAAQPMQGPQIGTSGLAVASMVLGIIALVFFCFWPIAIPCGVIGIILGGIGASECKGPNPRRTGMGMAIAGISCASVSIGLYVIVFLLVGVASLGPF